MARVDPEYRDRQRRKRKVIVLAVLGVLALGLIVKRAIPPSRAIARSEMPAPVHAESNAKPLVLLMPAAGVELVSTTQYDPFGSHTPEPVAAVAITAGFKIDGLLRGRVSFATINGVRRKEGDTFDGVLLKQVEADGVVLVVAGVERFVEIKR